MLDNFALIMVVSVMLKCGDKQQVLIETEQAVKSVRLVAAGGTYYVVAIIRIERGYLVRKASGAARARPNVETWFRPRLSDATLKMSQLIAGKLRKTKGRIYKVDNNDKENA